MATIKIQNREGLKKKIIDENYQLALKSVVETCFSNIEQFYNAEIEKAQKELNLREHRINLLQSTLNMEKKHSNPWVKCSERLPEENQEVLLSIEGKRYIGELIYNDKAMEYYLYVPAYSEAEYLKSFYMDDKENLNILWQRIVPPGE